jgi:hypothetical protein
MKRLFICLLFLILSCTFVSAQNQQMEVYGYLTTWSLQMGKTVWASSNYENMLYTNLDREACTRYITFNADLNADGTMKMASDWYPSPGNTAWGNPYFQIPKRRFLNNWLHEANKGVELCIFLGSNSSALQTDAGISAVIKTVVDSAIGATNRYDGIHWDIEPMNVADTAQVRKLISRCADTLAKYHQWADESKKPTQSVAIYNNFPFWGRTDVHSKLDAILHMSYNMYGNWMPIAWFNAPVYETAYESSAYNVGSIKGYTESILASGVPKNKLVMACPFNYNAFQGGLTTTGEGVYEPFKTWTTFPKWLNTNNEMYYDAWNKWIDTATTTIHQDLVRKACWIGYNNEGTTNDMYILFQDTMCIRANIEYIASTGIKGAMIWEITGAYINNLNQTRHPGVSNDHMLQTVKKARLASVYTPSAEPIPTIDTTNLYNVGFTAGKASVNIDSIFTAGKNSIIWNNVSYVYVASTVFPDTAVVLPQGSLILTQTHSATNKKTTLTFLKPKK